MLMRLAMPPGMSADGTPIGMNIGGSGGGSNTSDAAAQAMAAGQKAMEAMSGHNTTTVKVFQERERLIPSD